jgi:DNA-binding response OmpR family regulator
MPKTVILVVEDDRAIRRGICDSLKFAGYGVEECSDGKEGLDRAMTARADLVLLDVLLPKIDGFEVLTELRKASPRLPVIMLTAKGDEADRVRGLKLGADDYVVKPFSATELLARVEAVLRRSAERPTDLPRLELEDRYVDLQLLEIVPRHGTPQRISELEGDLLRYLVINRGRPIDRKELLQRVWSGNAGLETRTVDMSIRRLREKLETDPANPRLILTVRSRGYMFAEEIV